MLAKGRPVKVDIKKRSATNGMRSKAWWFKQILFLGGSLFFLVFGIDVLVAAYTLKHPQQFVMFFFSGSFIVLISIVGLLYPIFQFLAFFRPPASVEEDD